MISRKAHVIGKPFPLIEAQRKLTGVSCYAGDEQIEPDMLHARILFSAHPRARITLRGVEKARKHPGVAALLTAKDINGPLGHTIADRELLAAKEVIYAGQPLAIVAAETPEAAEEALQLLQVAYQDLPAVLDIDQALQPDSPKVHPDFASYPGADRLNADPERNIAHSLHFSRGDIKKGFAEADVIIEHTYTAAHQQHAPMETHGGVARLQPDGVVTMWMHVQSPFLQREIISRALDVEPAKIRIISGCVGGSFGSKSFVSVEGLLAAIARRTEGRPVRLLLNREEEFKGVFMTPAMRAHIKMGATQDGRITAIEASYDWDVGASVDASLHHLQAVVLAGTGPYAIPNAEIRTRAIYTNLLPAAPLRGLGIAQVHWAIEQHIDELSEALSISPLALRQANLIKGGDQLFPTFTMHANGLQSCGMEAAKAINWQQEMPEGKTAPSGTGQGMAIGWSPILQFNGSSVTIRCDADNLCDVIIDGVDIGQGLYAFATQLISFELNIPIEWIRVEPTDTANYDPTWQASYQNLMWSTGHALLKASAQLKKQIMDYVARVWEEPVTNLDIIEGEVVSYASRRRRSVLTLLEEGCGLGDAPPSFKVTASYRPPHTNNDIEAPLLSYASTAYAAEVEVDEKTGNINILQLAAAIDVGHALNPESVKAQIKGGMTQSVSFTLLEEMIIEDGVPRTLNFMEYPIATTADMPQQLHPIVIEVPQQSGPYGARDLSNHVLVGAAPAIANAIYRATGVRIRDLPISPQRIYDEIRAMRAGKTKKA